MFQLEHDHDQTVPTSPGVVKQVGLVAFETTTTAIQNFRADLFEDHPSEGNETLKARSFHKRNEILYSFLNVLAYLKKKNQKHFRVISYIRMCISSTLKTEHYFLKNIHGKQLISEEENLSKTHIYDYVLTCSF
jgi:hypothetical protein